MKKEKKIAVIGAGISGLTLAKMMSQVKGFHVSVFEKSEDVGGIAKVRMVGDFPYHKIGGHCFNSKHPEVLDFIFNNVLEKDEWNLIERKASILFKGTRLDYPIEFSMKRLYESQPELALEFIEDYLNADHKKVDNLADWFVSNFGKSLAEQYFIPYNKKIWGRDPSEMSPDWVVDKLPQPNKKSFIKGLFSSASDNMPHSTFYYPKCGSQNRLIDSLASGLNIKKSSKVENIKKDEDGSFSILDERFDIVIYTGPMNKAHEVFNIGDSKVLNAINDLKYNKVTTMLWESKSTDFTWTYLPDEDVLFHRMIHIGNFTQNSYPVTITETVGEVSYDDMVEAGKKIDMLLNPLDYNVSDHAYVVFDKLIDENKSIIKDYFADSNVHFLGRFGQWDYFNMDVCMLEAMKLRDMLVSQ